MTNTERDLQKAGKRIYERAWEWYIQPEIDRRREAGTIPDGFEPYAVQITMNVDAPISVRLNEEVSAFLRTQVIRTLKKGESVSAGDIAEIEHMELTGRDPNAAHVSMIFHRGAWQIYSDFRYNAERIRTTLDFAHEFLETAADALKAGRLRPFVDILYSALELMARAWVLQLPDRKFLGGVAHRTIKFRLNRPGGNLKHVERQYLDLFNRYPDLRDKARYRLEPIPVTTTSATEDLESTRQFYVYLQKHLPGRRRPIKSTLD